LTLNFLLHYLFIKISDKATQKIIRTVRVWLNYNLIKKMKFPN
jgi:hypothetical protein